MGFIKYFGAWLETAFKHSLGTADTITAGIIALVGLLSWLSRYLPKDY